MSDLRFTSEHEWIRVEGDTGTVGISAYAQGQLGDMVFVDLPKVGLRVEKGAEMAVAESVKAASEVYAPAGGEVIEVNAALNTNPAAVNEDPYGRGWFLRLRLSDPGELATLMDQSTYEAYVKGLG
ncbi:MAG: glycine cleavage system protein GcvH [Alphaproteobacteria bacterium]